MNQEVITHLKEFPIKNTISVQWGEMDAFQHVNSAVYIKWAETARVAYFAGIKDELLDLKGKKIGPILANIQCKYIFPVTFPDTVIIGTHISAFKEDRFKMDHLIVSEKHHRVVAALESWIVTYDYRSLSKVNLPDHMEEIINAYEGNR